MPFIQTNQCRGCAACVSVCPENAISMDSNNLAVIDQSLCTKCGACIESCPFGLIRPNSEDPNLRMGKNSFILGRKPGQGRGAGMGRGRGGGGAERGRNHGF